MPKLSKSLAFVLKRKEILNKDFLITLFTQELGKVTVVAKGIKQITSRRSPHVQTGNLINCQLSRSDTGYYLQQSDLISGFTDIKNNQDKLEYMYTFFFIIDRMLPAEQVEPEMFQMTKAFLVELARMTEVSSTILRKYLFLTLVHLGYINEEKPLDELIQTVEEIINEKVPTSVII